jgi:hypothetical protein
MSEKVATPCTAKQGTAEIQLGHGMLFKHSLVLWSSVPLKKFTTALLLLASMVILPTTHRSTACYALYGSVAMGAKPAMLSLVPLVLHQLSVAM